MNDILVKYKLLDEKAKKDLDTHLNLLITKQRKMSLKSLKALFKQKLLQVSVWDESSLKVFEENSILFNNWRIAER